MTYPFRFGGKCEEYKDETGAWRTRGVGDEIVEAMAYDNPFPGFDTFNTNELRLWRCLPSEVFDFLAFKRIPLQRSGGSPEEGGGFVCRLVPKRW